MRRTTNATTTDRVRRRGRAALAGVLAVGALVAAACVPPPTPPPAVGPNPDDAPRAAEAAYVGPGPHQVGVTTLDLGDRRVEVWYPADDTAATAPFDEYHIRDFVGPVFDAIIPASVNPAFVTDAHRGVPADTDGPYPLVVFSHGFASFRLASSELSTHIASWGFVVIAPDYLERGLASVLGAPPAAPRDDAAVAAAAIDAVKAADGDAGSVLHDVVDSTTVYPVGHSAGGGTALRMLARPDVTMAIPMASGISMLNLIQGNATVPPEGKSVFWMGGRSDGIASIDNVRTGYDYTPGEKKILELDGEGHNNGFTDICEIGDGGVVALAVASGIPVPEFLANLGNDGCPQPPFTESSVLWPQIGHFLVAELRYRSGLDPEPVGLGSQVTASPALPNVGSYRHTP